MFWFVCLVFFFVFFFFSIFTNPKHFYHLQQRRLSFLALPHLSPSPLLPIPKELVTSSSCLCSSPYSRHSTLTPCTCVITVRVHSVRWTNWRDVMANRTATCLGSSSLGCFEEHSASTWSELLPPPELYHRGGPSISVYCWHSNTPVQHQRAVLALT